MTQTENLPEQQNEIERASGGRVGVHVARYSKKTFRYLPCKTNKWWTTVDATQDATNVPLRTMLLSTCNRHPRARYKHNIPILCACIRASEADSGEYICVTTVQNKYGQTQAAVLLGLPG